MLFWLSSLIVNCGAALLKNFQTVEATGGTSQEILFALYDLQLARHSKVRSYEVSQSFALCAHLNGTPGTKGLPYGLKVRRRGANVWA